MRGCLLTNEAHPDNVFRVSPTTIIKKTADNMKRTVTLINKLGLHARAAAKFVTLASRFHADIRVCRQQREVNGKSIMGVMMLAASCGSTLEIHATGEDAEAALAALEALIQQRFGEEE